MEIEIFGIALSLTSLLFAILQTIRLKKLRKKDEADLWTLVFTSRKVIYNLENSKSIEADVNIAKAYSRAKSIHEDLISFLAHREKKFTSKTLERWKQTNKITKSWQEDQARQHLDK